MLCDCVTRGCGDHSPLDRPMHPGAVCRVSTHPPTAPCPPNSASQNRRAAAEPLAAPACSSGLVATAARAARAHASVPPAGAGSSLATPAMCLVAKRIIEDLGLHVGGSSRERDMVPLPTRSRIHNNLSVSTSRMHRCAVAKAAESMSKTPPSLTTLKSADLATARNAAIPSSSSACRKAADRGCMFGAVPLPRWWSKALTIWP
jgi:hypothetical protein